MGNKYYILIEYNDKFILSENGFFSNANKEKKFLKNQGFKDLASVLQFIKNNFKIDIQNISIINGQF